MIIFCFAKTQLAPKQGLIYLFLLPTTVTYLKIKMGNSDSKYDDIILQNQKIEDWFISENQGSCELWINKKTGRRFQAYTIPQAAATDPQQLQKYAFRKNHGTYLVAVEGVLKQANGFLCSHASSSFVLVENITSRLSDHYGDLTFEQALYILSAAGNGYNTLNSFFGPLQPTEDMICINEVGQLKVWLNQNLAMNDPSLNAKGYIKNGDKESLKSQDYALAKNRIKQCVGKLFNIVETASQGFPPRFKQESKNISTYFEAVNFVEYFSEQNAIKIPDHLSPIPKLQITRESEACSRPIVTNQQINRHAATNAPFSQERQENLGTSRINYVYKSNFINDSPSKYQEQVPSAGPIRMVSLPPNNQQPKIAFQVRPPNAFQPPNTFQPIQYVAQQPIASLPTVCTPIMNVQEICFPPPNIVYTPNNVAFPPILPPIESKTNRPAQIQNKQGKRQDTLTTENSHIPNNYNIDIKRAVSLEQKIYQPKVHYKHQNYLVQESSGYPNEDHSQPYNEQDDMHETQFTFQNQLQMYQEYKNKQKKTQESRYSQQINQDQNQQENWRSKYQQLLSNSTQRNKKQTAEKSKAHSPAYDENNNLLHNNKYYRSPIPEQDQNFSPTPNQKTTQIEEWERKLNKFTKSGTQIALPEHQIKESQKRNVNPQPITKAHAQQKAVKQQFANIMADLGHEDLQKYVRAKYLDQTEIQPTPQQAKTYNQRYNYQPLEEIQPDYKYSYNHKSEVESWKRPQQNYSKFTTEYEPLAKDKRSEPLIGGYEYETYELPSFGDKITSIENNFQLKRKTNEKPASKHVQFCLPNAQPQSYDQDYISRKQPDRKRTKVSDTTKIDQKYSKYVLNSQKPKPIASISKENNNLKLNEDSLPMEDLNLSQLNTKQKSNRKTNRSSKSKEKKHVTYGKLTSLLWEQ